MTRSDLLACLSRHDLLDSPDLLEFGLMAAADPHFVERLLGLDGPRPAMAEMQSAFMPESR